MPPIDTVGAITVQRGTAEALHVQVERALRQQIHSGAWSPGSKLPPEPLLADQIGINRGTLRRALAALIDDGLLVAERGRGTFIAAAAVTSTIAQHYLSLTEDLAAQGIPITPHVVSSRIEPAPAAVQDTLEPEAPGTDPPLDVLRLERIFHGPTRPLAYLLGFVRAADCPGIEHIDFTQASLFGTLADRFNIHIARGSRTFSARAANHTVADHLQVGAGTPVLHLSQTSYTSSGLAVEYSEVWFDSAAISITTDLERARDRATNTATSLR